jgi:hypothetical protein
MILQLDREPLMKELSFLCIRDDVMSPIMGETVVLAAVAIHGVVPMLQVEELLQLMEGNAKLTPWNMMILR